ncbi:TrmH family RNA methyltransferase [Bifidobacterium choloepi]|uniref:RNA methyltransferase n=1 Tax=Bifidobacterium choloepi TaxID=2614131 RepID=A0A6I5NIN0_9BIFI|nr:RNA methyltransferase [Bifidobacterium choloepi]NEG70233.1 RNA methyltransferase [Bifidobacterium choloepi]
MPMYSEVLANPKAERFRRVRELLTRKGRQKNRRFVVEGPQAVREVLDYRPDIVQDVYVAVDGAEDDAMFVNPTVARLAGKALQAANMLASDSGADHAADHDAGAGATIYVHKATRAVVDSVSEDAQGIFAVASLDDYEAPLDDIDIADLLVGNDDGNGPLIAAFWQVRDPGNAGTVIRSADAAGCDAVLLVDDCVEPVNPKVVRATTGSLFHLPVFHVSERRFFDIAAGARIVAADVHGTDDLVPVSLPDYVRDADPKQPRIVLFGNEARGLKPETLERCTDIVSIPIYGHAESLNLAMSASIMLMTIAMHEH